MKSSIIAITLALASASLSARSWTSADGSRELQGELKSFDQKNERVILLVDGKEVAFDLAKLSAEDQAFLKQNPTGKKSETIPQLLAKAKLHQVEKGKWKEVSFEGEPEYVLIYYSASW